MAIQLTLPIDIDEQRSFDDFIDLPNRQLIEHLKFKLLQRKSKPDSQYYAVIVWGESSSGKTHLMIALTNLFKQQGGAVQWLRPGLDRRSDRDQARLIYVLDDIEQFVQTSVDRQALLTVIEEIKQQNGLLLITAKHAISGLNIGLADLSSRLQALDSFELLALDEAEKRLVLKQRAHQRGIVLSNEVINWLFTHTPRDLGKLFQILDQVDAVSLAQHRKVTIALIKSIIETD